MRVTLENPSYYHYIVTLDNEEKETLLFTRNILQSILLGIKPMEGRIRECNKGFWPEKLKDVKNVIEILYKSGEINFEIDNPEE